MMLSIFQSISIPSTWLRWVKWRGWWQTKSKLRGCLMKRTRHTARPVCTLIVSELVYCHLPNDWSLRSGIVKWILSCYSVISSSGWVSHWAGMSLCLWFLEWFHHIFPYASEYLCYCRTQLIFLFFSFRNIDHGRNHQWILMLCEVLGVTPLFQTMRPFSMCIHHILGFCQINLYLADNSKTFITTLLPMFSLLSSVKWCIYIIF